MRPNTRHPQVVHILKSCVLCTLDHRLLVSGDQRLELQKISIVASVIELLLKAWLK